MGLLGFVNTVVCRDGDALGTPSTVAPAGRAYYTLLLAGQSGIVVVIVGVVAPPSDDLVDQPTPADIVAVNDTSVPQLYALSCPVDPCKVKVKEGLDDAKGNADGEDEAEIVLGGAANDPVQNVKSAVGPKCGEVETIDDGGDGRLAEEKQLREDAEGFEDQGKSVGNLFATLVWLGSRRQSDIPQTCA